MNKKQKRKFKRWHIVVAIIAVIIIIAMVFANMIIDDIVESEIHNQLNSNENSLYNLEFEKININIYTGSLTVKMLTVTPSDSAKSLLKNNKIPKLIEAKVPKFKIRGLGIYDFIRNHVIGMSGIIIDGLSVKYLINNKAKEVKKKNTLILHEVFSENFKEAAIGEISIKNTDLHFYQAGETENEIFSIDSVFVTVNDILINKETLKQAIPASFKDVSISTGHFSFNSMEYYKIYTEDIHFDVKDTSLYIDGFKLIPKYSKEDYNKKIQYNDDWFSIETERIIFNGLSVSELEFNETISFNSLEIKGPKIKIYRDKRLPDAPFKKKPLLGGMIKKIPVNINIDTLLIIDGKLQYQEQLSTNPHPGVVYFEPLFLTAYNITNHPDLININPVCEIDLRGKIMAESFLEAKLNIDLSSNFEEFTMSGTLDPVSGVVFNPMVEKLMPAKILSGNVTKTEFSFKANDIESNGKLILEYNNLKIDVVKNKEDHQKRSGFLSMLANEIIRVKNQPDQGKYIVGNIHFQRRQDRAIVNFLWNSVKTGIISVVAPIADKSKKDEKKEANGKKKETRKRRKKKE